MPLTPSERSTRASIAGATRWAHTDRRQASADARRRQMAKYEALVDPDGQLDPAERAARADNARKADMQRLALKSAKARRLRAGGPAATSETPNEATPADAPKQAS
ncbi:hypothetical protein BH23ACT2_BH23ACT2_15380 [soil metagenome]